MSNAVAKAYAENSDRFMKEIPPFEVCYCPDKITGLLLTLLGHHITTFAPEHQNSMLAYGADSGHMNDAALSVPEFMLYHYITPRKLLAADQRVHHEKVRYGSAYNMQRTGSTGGGGADECRYVFGVSTN
jgi:hypothetical protein